MCRAPTEVSTEFGPRIGRSGDSPVSDGASSGLALSSDCTWSGCAVTTNGSRRESSLISHTSPKRAREARLYSSGSRTNTSDCVRREPDRPGGSRRGVVGSTGPAAARSGRSEVSGASGGAVTVDMVRECTSSEAAGLNRLREPSLPAAKETKPMPDRAAIVTGASRGIGLAIARELAEQGYALTITARKPDRLEQTATSLRDEGHDVEAVAANMSDEGGIQGVVAAHRERFSRLDVLVNNAG